MTSTKYVPPSRVRPGDLATNRNTALPERPVEAVDRAGERIRLRFPGGHVSAWLPRGAFTFVREVEDE